MGLQKFLRERILSIIGVLLIAIAADGILSPEFFVYSSPELGGAVPTFSTQEFVSQVVSVADWPLYIPLLFGCVLIALDLYYHFTKNKVKIA